MCVQSVCRSECLPSSKYFLADTAEASTFSEARQACIDEGSDLASVDSAGDLSELQTLCPSFEFWINFAESALDLDEWTCTANDESWYSSDCSAYSS